jgi:nucleoside-diphosphate-sugar epimerase
MKKILVTGSEGYIGSILMPMLIERDFIVSGCDPGFFSEGNLIGTTYHSYEMIKKDMRDLTEDDLDGYDAIVSLAAMCNDPLGELLEELTYDINYHSTIKLAKIAKNAGVKRFIYSSSCSLYGEGGNKVLTEEDKPNPITAYGKSKILAENELLKLSDSDFSTVSLRNATAHGISPRMRFNIVVNSLTGFAKTTRLIQILGDGNPWRPLVHIKDISGVIIKVLESDKRIIHNQIYNVGDHAENYQIKEIAEHVKAYYPDCNITIAQKQSSDTRNYTVSFEKLNKQLGYHCKYTMDMGIKEMFDCYEMIDLDEETFNHRMYSRLKQMKFLLETKLVNENLRWI